MGNKFNIQIITEDDLKSIERIIQLPTIILNDKEVLFINHKFQEMLGYSLDEIRKPGLINSIIEEPKENLIEHMINMFKENTSSIKNELKMRTKNNNIIWVNYESTLVSYKSQKYLLTNLLHITQKKKTNIHLSEVLKVGSLMLEINRALIGTDDIYSLYQLILKNALKCIRNAKLGTIMIKDGEKLKTVSHVGFKYSAISNFEIPIKESFLYQKTNGKLDRIVKIDDTNQIPTSLYYIDTTDENSKYIKSTITAPIYIYNVFFGVVNVDSTEVNSFDLYDIKIMEFIKTYVEIAISNRLLYKEKVHLSRHDFLTGTYNKGYFQELLKDIHHKALITGENFNLVIFDLNNLKYINDTFGHLAGDTVIKNFAEECSKLLGKRDILARFGGDEFVGIFLDYSEEQLKKMLDNCFNDLENTSIYFQDNKLKYSFSYGVSTFNKDANLINDLISIADRNMYMFKKKYKIKSPLV